MVEILLSDPAVKNACEEFESELALLELGIQSDDIQKEVAKIMHNTKSVVSPL